MNKTNQSLAHQSAGLLVVVVAALLYVACTSCQAPAPKPASSFSPVAAAPISPIATIIVASPAPTPIPPSPIPPPPIDLVVLHTNDTWGYLLPCG